MKGRLEAAAKSLAYVRGQPAESEYIKDELAEIVANHEYELQIVPQTSYIGSWMACFHGSIHKGNSNIRRIILGSGLQCMQQLTGTYFSNPLSPPPCKILTCGKVSISSFISAQPSFSSSAPSRIRF
jgi:Sugar (and other) transporter